MCIESVSIGEYTYFFVTEAKCPDRCTTGDRVTIPQYFLMRYFVFNVDRGIPQLSLYFNLVGLHFIIDTLVPVQTQRRWRWQPGNQFGNTSHRQCTDQFLRTFIYIYIFTIRRNKLTWRVDNSISTGNGSFDRRKRYGYNRSRVTARKLWYNTYTYIVVRVSAIFFYLGLGRRSCIYVYTCTLKIDRCRGGPRQSKRDHGTMEANWRVERSIRISLSPAIYI
jgi:hypothetical protein